MDDNAGLRPFHFSVVVWGERFRTYFLDWCVAALLSPGNFPALPKGPAHKFLIASTPEDWAELWASPIFTHMAEFIEPVLLPIPPAPPGMTGCQHMGIGHKAITEYTFQERAYGVLLTPDLMLSDGTVAALVAHARAGKRIVLSPALRFAEEPLFASLREQGYFTDPTPPSVSGRPVAVPPRALARAALGGMHSETLSYEWDAPWFTDFPVACWWAVPDEEGILVHSFSWIPLLLDYDVLDCHDTSTMDHWTIDGDYVAKNFRHDPESIHIVLDSDELFVASWAPLDDRRLPLRPERLKSSDIIGRWYRRVLLNRTFQNPVFDDFKRAIFPVAVYWHAGEPGLGRAQVTRRASALIRAALAPQSAWSRQAYRGLAFLRKARVIAFYGRRGWELVCASLGGDQDARRRLTRRLRLMGRGLINCLKV